MIREATVNDAGRIAEIEVFSSRYAYKNIVSDGNLWQNKGNIFLKRKR